MTSTGIALSQVSDDFDDLFTKPSLHGRTILTSYRNPNDPEDPWTNRLVLAPKTLPTQVPSWWYTVPDVQYLPPYTHIHPPVSRRVPSCYVPPPTPRHPPLKCSAGRQVKFEDELSL